MKKTPFWNCSNSVFVLSDLFFFSFTEWLLWDVPRNRNTYWSIRIFATTLLLVALNCVFSWRHRSTSSPILTACFCPELLLAKAIISFFLHPLFSFSDPFWKHEFQFALRMSVCHMCIRMCMTMAIKIAQV